MKKLLLLLLAFPLFFAACSSDDEEGGDEFTNMKLTSESVLDKLELQWTKVDKAYGYQVYFQVEGETEWQETNFRMAKADDPAIIRWDGGEFNYFNESVTYTIYVKAFRDSQEGSVIGESNKIVESLSSSDPTEVPKFNVVGKWSQRATQPKDVLANDPDLVKFIQDYFTHDVSDSEYDEYLELKADGTFASAYAGNGTTLHDSGVYAIEGDNLTMTYKIIEGLELANEDVQEYKLNVLKNTLFLTSDFNEEEYEYLINLFNKENPKEGLSISKITFTGVFVRL